MPTPNLTSFFAAAQTMREQFGSQITFSVPQSPVWPVGTRINPSTGEPYSAMVQRTNAAFVAVAVTALVILKEASPLRPQADSQFAEAGLMSGMDIIIDLNAADYAAVEAASELEYAGKNYRVEEFKPFELAGTLYRWLVYGKER